MTKKTSEFLTWFEAQHGKRQKHTNVTDQMLRDQAMAGTRAQAELLRREEWDARHQSALYAWQAARSTLTVTKTAEEWLLALDLKNYTILSPDGWTNRGLGLDAKLSQAEFEACLAESSVKVDHSFVPATPIPHVDLTHLANSPSGVAFTEVLDSILADDGYTTERSQVAGTLVESKDGAVAEYGEAKEGPASSHPDPATGMTFETKHLGKMPASKIVVIGEHVLASYDGWVFREDAPNPRDIWKPFGDEPVRVEFVTSGGHRLIDNNDIIWWGYDPFVGMKDSALVLAARKVPAEGSDVEDPPEKCPECGQQTVVARASGVACTNPGCGGYQFCY